MGQSYRLLTLMASNGRGRWRTGMIAKDKHFLSCLGWHTSAGVRTGRWCVLAWSCGQTVISTADTEEDAWAAACSMALDVTAPSLRDRREGRG